jgi:hypothetical protein
MLMARGHGREEMRGVVFLVDHLVADQGPACGLGHFDVQALLLVKAQRIGHDERRGAGDRDEADLEVGFFQRAFALRQGLQAGHGQHAGNGGHGGLFAHGAQKHAALLVLRKQGLDQGGFDEFLAVSLELGGLRPGAQLRGCGIGRHFGVVIGRRMVAAAAALEHQGAVGVVRVKKFRHGKLALLKMLSPMQAVGQKCWNAGHRQPTAAFQWGACRCGVGLALQNP